MTVRQAELDSLHATRRHESARRPPAAAGARAASVLAVAVRDPVQAVGAGTAAAVGTAIGGGNLNSAMEVRPAAAGQRCAISRGSATWQP